MWVIHQSLYLVSLFVKIALSSLIMKLLAGTILETLLVGAFKGTPNICDLRVGSQNSILLENPAQKTINNSVRVLVCEKPLKKKR